MDGPGRERRLSGDILCRLCARGRNRKKRGFQGGGKKEKEDKEKCIGGKKRPGSARCKGRHQWRRGGEDILEVE